MQHLYEKIILDFLARIFASAFAEGTPKKPSVAGFVSNGFWDNWEMGSVSELDRLFQRQQFGPRSDRFKFEGKLSLTKWVHPIAGIRAQLQGGWSTIPIPRSAR